MGWASSVTRRRASRIPGPIPYPAYDADLPLQKGMVLSIETTILHPRRGFIKLEDTVAVTESGPEGFGDRGRGWNRCGAGPRARARRKSVVARSEATRRLGRRRRASRRVVQHQSPRGRLRIGCRRVSRSKPRARPFPPDAKQGRRETAGVGEAPQKFEFLVRGAARECRSKRGAIVHPFFKIVSALALGLSISGCVTAEPPYPNVVPIDTTGNFGAR